MLVVMFYMELNIVRGSNTNCKTENVKKKKIWVDRTICECMRSSLDSGSNWIH